jgi:hypothetical protein
MRRENEYALILHLAQKPGFCCCCWSLSADDSRRTKRVLRLVRAVMKDWQETYSKTPQPGART